MTLEEIWQQNGVNTYFSFANGNIYKIHHRYKNGIVCSVPNTDNGLFRVKFYQTWEPDRFFIVNVDNIDLSTINT